MQAIIWVFFILGAIFKSSIFFGAGLIAIGAVIFFSIKQEAPSSNKAAAVIGSFFSLFGRCF